MRVLEIYSREASKASTLSVPRDERLTYVLTMACEGISYVTPVEVLSVLPHHEVGRIMSGDLTIEDLCDVLPTLYQERVKGRATENG